MRAWSGQNKSSHDRHGVKLYTCKPGFVSLIQDPDKSRQVTCQTTGAASFIVQSHSDVCVAHDHNSHPCITQDLHLPIRILHLRRCVFLTYLLSGTAYLGANLGKHVRLLLLAGRSSNRWPRSSRPTPTQWLGFPPPV